MLAIMFLIEGKHRNDLSILNAVLNPGIRRGTREILFHSFSDKKRAL